jgi:secondary thiamine-phosphate synthase enzyme
MRGTFSLSTSASKQSLDITAQVRDVVASSGVRSGLCHVMVMHSTAAVIVNETDDPNVGVDILTALDRAVPDHADWKHDRVDNNAQAHIKASILGASETIPVEEGQMQLGTWQRIMLMEFDGPRTRQVSVRILSEDRER